MRPDAAIGDRVAPVDQPFGCLVARITQPRADQRERLHDVPIARQGVRQGYLFRVCIDAPIRAPPCRELLGNDLALVVDAVSSDERLHQVAPAQRSNLIVNHIKHALQLANPVGSDLRRPVERATAIADKNGGIALLDRLQAVIVVNAAVGKNDALAKWTKIRTR